MTDHTAHIEECEREREAAWGLLRETGYRAPEALARHKRAMKAHKDALVKAYGVPCPVEACEDGHVMSDFLGKTTTSPAEPITEYCDYCEGRGMVLPAQADAYQGD